MKKVQWVFPAERAAFCFLITQIQCAYCKQIKSLTTWIKKFEEKLSDLKEKKKITAILLRLGFFSH